MNIIQELEQEQIGALAADKGELDFAPGDTVRVNVKVVEGSRERIQAFEGVCIARKNRGINSSFTVRKISFGEGVERVFPLYSPRIDSVHVVRRGDVRRAKLYYLRGRTGKAAWPNGRFPGPRRCCRSSLRPFPACSASALRARVLKRARGGSTLSTSATSPGTSIVPSTTRPSGVAPEW